MEKEIPCIGIICNHDEEAHAATFIFRKHGGVNFSPKLAEPFSYDEGILKIDDKEIKIVIAFAVNPGETFALELMKDFLRISNPGLAIMTGVCSGKRGRTKVGDLVVADKAFLYTSGEVTNDGLQNSIACF